MLPEGYAVRLAVANDLARLPEIEVAAGELFRTAGMHDVAGDEGLPVEDYQASLVAKQLWVVAHHGIPVGYVLALHLDGRAHLEQLSVDPAHGRLGLGAALVDEVVRWAEARGGADLTLATFRDVAWNRPYYERLGFVVVPDEDLTPALRELRLHEAELGLDVDARVIMRRQLDDGLDRRTRCV